MVEGRAVGAAEGESWQALRASRARPMNASREDPEEGFHRTGTATDILRLQTLLGIGLLPRLSGLPDGGHSSTR
jgi:hypothetical protein